jgi:regulator of sirC expression with transglutaminase-like and TPR domain
MGCVWLIKLSASHGISRLLTRSALTLQSLAAAQAATSITPADPQAHRANAALLSQFDQPAEAIVAVEQALALRPRDYSLWYGLGLLRDRMGDTKGALEALDQAVERAPFYAHPRWQRGNVFLRAGQYEEAFADLNFAAQSNPELIHNLIDLAWGVTRGDPQLTEQLLDIRTDKSRLTFARFLAARGRAVESMRQLNAAGKVDEKDRRELIRQLLEKRAFAEAYYVWSGTDPSSNLADSRGIHDGGFEATLSTNESGFGWRVSDTRSVSLSIDPNEPHSGARSLRMDFSSDGPSPAMLSQLLIVKPSTRYRIHFAARSRDVVTGARPLVSVTDAGENGSELALSAPLERGTSGWRPFSIDFTTGAATNAVTVAIKREGCPSAPCPIFGSISLDSFSIEQAK